MTVMILLLQFSDQESKSDLVMVVSGVTGVKVLTNIS